MAKKVDISAQKHGTLIIKPFLSIPGKVNCDSNRQDKPQNRSGSDKYMLAQLQKQTQDNKNDI